ncbi:hypothetical protein EZV63_08950 [Streptomyces sp. VN1]|nr:hypothetical protein EZV63_08950 [Streptomyces sp. VN1]
MPSVTVVVSSDTDIYISPGLYGDCLPTVSTAGAADSFRARRVFLLGVLSPSCSHTPPRAVSARRAPAGEARPGDARYGGPSITGRSHSLAGMRRIASPDSASRPHRPARKQGEATDSRQGCAKHHGDD